MNLSKLYTLLDAREIRCSARITVCIILNSLMCIYPGGNVSLWLLWSESLTSSLDGKALGKEGVMKLDMKRQLGREFPNLSFEWDIQRQGQVGCSRIASTPLALA